MSCSCPRVWSRLLEITQLEPLNPPTAKFSLGKNFGCNKIKVEAEITVGTDTPFTQTMKLRTDKNGDFSYTVPIGTTLVTQVVTLRVTQCNPHNVVDKTCLKTAGYYPLYTSAQLAWRSYDGVGNNLSTPLWGAVNVPLARVAPSDYADGVNTLAVRTGANAANPRFISNNINKQTVSVPSSFGLSNWIWVFGQGIDHEIDLTNTNSADPANIVTPTVIEDPEEDYPSRTILFSRSQAIDGTSPREQANTISSFIDASNVYGYISTRASALRLMDGTGKLATATADNGETILPYNVDGLPNASHGPAPASSYFLAGDVRANENTFLTAFHTLFVREHNRLCDQIVTERPGWAGKGELIYQHARRFVAGIMQAIVYNEFLPALLGDDAVADWNGYDPAVNPNIATEFSTVGYRLGHTMIPSDLQVSDTPGDNELLRDLFFNPAYVQANGVDNMIIGATTTVMQQIDGMIVDDLRNFLFEAPSVSHLLDLATLNIQRGRDHGIPGYNAVRVGYGLAAATTFADVTSDVAVQGKLAAIYSGPGEIDPWVGAIVEDHVTGAAVGELVTAILKDQFERFRDGDHYYFENDKALTVGEKNDIRATKMSDVIIRNTAWTSADIPEDVFHV